MDEKWRDYHRQWEGRHWLDRAMEHWDFNRKFLRKLAALLQPGDPLLDIGCGKGYSALYFAAHGHPVTGIDTDADSVGEASTWASRLGLPARFLVGNVFSWRPESRFRMSYSMGLVEHFPPEQAVRLLSNQGDWSEFVVAMAPTHHSLRTVAPCSIPWTPQSIGTLHRTFRAAGISVVASFGAGTVWSRWDSVLAEALPPAAINLLQNRASYAMNAVVVGRRRG